MSLELYPFQAEGARFLADRRRALLADEMGVGKTPQAIRALGDRRRKVLVVAPAIAGPHWEREFDAWSQAEHKVEVISYDRLRGHLRQYLQDWTHLIVDECHFAKNATAQRTHAIFGPQGVARRARRTWLLSGTPAPNHYGELFIPLKSFGLWRGTYKDFLRRYCIVTPVGEVLGSTRDPARVAELRGILEGFMLRRKKEHVYPDMPPISVNPWPVEADAKYLSDIAPVDGDRTKHQAIAQAKELEAALARIPNKEDWGAYLQEHFDHYGPLRKYNGILKVPAVFEAIKFELENRLVDKVVVYAYHRAVIHLLQELLKGAGVNVTSVYGGTPGHKKENAQKKFKSWRRGVFIGQIQAAGTVIDLTTAHHGYIIEKDWVPGNNAQALMRMHRHGQTKPVTIRDVELVNSVDSVISATLTRKMRELLALFD